MSRESQRAHARRKGPIAHLPWASPAGLSGGRPYPVSLGEHPQACWGGPIARLFQASLSFPAPQPSCRRPSQRSSQPASQAPSHWPRHTPSPCPPPPPAAEPPPRQRGTRATPISKYVCRSIRDPAKPTIFRCESSVKTIFVENCCFFVSRCCLQRPQKWFFAKNVAQTISTGCATIFNNFHRGEGFCFKIDI